MANREVEGVLEKRKTQYKAAWRAAQDEGQEERYGRKLGVKVVRTANRRPASEVLAAVK